jgi:hypothetical protein
MRPGLWEERSCGSCGAAPYFAGVSVDGRVLPVNLGIDEVRYMSMAKADDTAPVFRLRREGAGTAEPSPLWLVPFKDSKKTESLANDVTDFAISATATRSS